MNNIVNYKEIMAFHPGYYVAEIVEEMGITQAEFAARMGTTGKTLSNLINGQINLSNDLAQKLSIMMGSSVGFWLNLQKEFDENVIEINRQREFDAQAEIVREIDYSYFEKVANLAPAKTTAEKVENLCRYFRIADLRILAKPDFLVNFRSAVPDTKVKNTINAQAWPQTALNFAASVETERFDGDKLKANLPEIRKMTFQEPEVFMPRLKQIFSECGVAFVLLPHLKNSGINGAVKWVNGDRAVLAMNDRRLYADTFWFSLFHETRHVLQQKTKSVFVSSDIQEMQAVDDRLEKEADLFAQNYLIPPKAYRDFAPTRYTSDEEIAAFAEQIGIHPGIVVGRLQHDGIIAQNRCSSLKQKYQLCKGLD